MLQKPLYFNKMFKILSLKVIVANEIDKSVGQATVYLIEEVTQTILPISVDLSSAEALVIAQQNLILPRPHTHDLMKRLVNCLGGNLIDVVIYDLQEGIYYSYLRLTSHTGELLEIDARPSDAIAMALRCEVPILVKEDVLLKGGVKISQNLLEE